MDKKDVIEISIAGNTVMITWGGESYTIHNIPDYKTRDELVGHIENLLKEYGCKEITDDSSPSTDIPTSNPS